MKTKNIVTLLAIAGIAFGAIVNASAQDGNFSKGETSPWENSGRLLTGNFGWNNQLFEETDPEGDQPGNTSSKKEKVAYKKMDKVLSTQAREALANDIAIDAIANAIFVEPIVADVYIEKMNHQAEDHEYILRMMDSLNNPIYRQPALTASIDNSMLVASNNKNSGSSNESTGVGTGNKSASSAKLNATAGSAYSGTPNTASTGVRDDILSAIPDIAHAIVLGSFNIPGNAKKYHQKLIEEGYQAHIIYSDKVKKHRVLISADSKKLAQHIAKDIRGTTQIKDAWVLSFR